MGSLETESNDLASMVQQAGLADAGMCLMIGPDRERWLKVGVVTGVGGALCTVVS